MGGPLSPGMTIITCAWMENLYLETLTSETKEKFTAARFMDDILMLYAKSDNWDYKRFTTDFEKSECYWPTLELEAGDENTFLESTFSIRNNNITYRLKNKE